jgi:FlaA1/EpsC-like NDP-sugar epimerase
MLPPAWVAAHSLGRSYDVASAGDARVLMTRLGRVFLSLVLLAAVLGWLVPALAGGFLLPSLFLALIGSAAVRAGALARLNSQRGRGLAVSPVLAVGRAASVQQLASALRLDPRAGRKVVGACLLDADAADPGLRRRFAELGITVTGGLAAIVDQIDRTGARTVAVTAGDLAGDHLRQLVWDVESTGAELLVSSGLAEVGRSRLTVAAVAGMPVLRVDSPYTGGFSRAF